MEKININRFVLNNHNENCLSFDSPESAGNEQVAKIVSANSTLKIHIYTGIESKAVKLNFGKEHIIQTDF